MSEILNSMKGTIHGKTIELESESGFPDGQVVTVTMQPAPETRPLPGAGFQNSAGAFADDAEGLDEFLEWNRRQRKATRGELPG